MGEEKEGRVEKGRDRAMEHRGHDVVCMRCNLLAAEFIDYERALRSKRPTIYARNKCICLYRDEFYCNDCKVKITIDAAHQP